MTPRSRTRRAIQWGKTLASFRRSLGLTQEQLGQQVGVTRIAVSLWESGDRTPSDQHKAHLAAVFGVDPSAIFPIVAEPYLPQADA